MLKLVLPTSEDKEGILDMVGEFHAHIPEIKGIDKFEGIRSFEIINDYEAWLKQLELQQHPEMLLENQVPSTTYIVKTEDRLVGAICIRKCLNESLLKVGGSISYGIRPSERQKGYGNEMLRVALDVCREIPLEKVLITCKKQNLPSARVIEKNGGVYENEVLVEDSGHIYLQYWIVLDNKNAEG